MGIYPQNLQKRQKKEVFKGKKVFLMMPEKEEEKAAEKIGKNFRPYFSSFRNQRDEKEGKEGGNT